MRRRWWSAGGAARCWRRRQINCRSADHNDVEKDFRRCIKTRQAWSSVGRMSSPRQFVEMCSERGSSPLYIAIIFVNYQPLTLAKCPLDWCRERASPRVWCILVSPLSNCDGFRFPEPYWLVLVAILAGTSRGGRECPPHHVGTRSSNAKTMKAKALAHIPCELDRGSKLSKN